ncbi:MAG: hypothetical protein ACPGKS_04675 [Coraliomargarita sp.]
MRKFKTAALCLLAASYTSLSQAAGTSVPVTDILSPTYVENKVYALEPEASVSRSIATFTVNSRHGSHTVVGTVGLEEHLAELLAIEKLEAMKKSKVYTDAAKNSALGPWDTAKGIVTEPITTVKESVKGLGGYLADIGYSVFSKDPSQENVAKTTLGFTTAKRKLAYELGVNPYSRYEPLQDALGEVAWTATGGGLTVTVLFSFVKDTPGTVLRVSKTAGSARKLVRDMSPRKLSNLNEETLLAMGLSATSVELLMENYNYDPETKTRLVTALETLKKADGLQLLVDSALIAGSPPKAQKIRDWVELLAAFHENVTEVDQIVMYSSAPFVVDADGVVYGVFPADYSEAGQGIEEQITVISEQIKADGFTQGEIYTTGKVEAELEAAFLLAGWKTVNKHVEDDLRTE